MWDALWLDAHLARMTTEAPYGAIEKAAIAARDGRIVFAGPEAELPGRPEDLAPRVERLDGRWITPGLIDCHTHLVYGGERAGEFEQRLEGVSYEEIARAGGGIRATVTATRAADRSSDRTSPNGICVPSDAEINIRSISEGSPLNSLAYRTRTA